MLKRDFSLFVRCLISAVALTAAFAVVCAAAAFSAVSGAEGVFSPVQTAVVDGERSLLSRLVVSTVARMDYVSDLMEITSCDMDEAMDGLEAGNYSAVIVLPEGTMEGIMSGQETRGTIYLSAEAAAHADIVARAAAFGEVMLAAGQYGVFSGEQLIRQHGLDDQFYRDFLSECNTRLISEAMRAGSDYFDIRITDYADTNLSTAAFYLVCWMSFLVVLIPMLFSGLYTRDVQKPILCRLRGLGVSDGEFLLGKLLFPAAFLAVLTVCSFVAAGRVIDLEITFGTILCAVLGVVEAAVCGGGIMMACRNGVPVVAAVSALGLLLCGGLIPRQALPEPLLAVGSVTPVGAIQVFFMPLFGGKITVLPVLAAVLYVVLLPVLVHRRLVRIRIGGDAV